MKNNRVLIFSTDDHLYPAGGAEQAMGNITDRLPHIQFDLICAKLRKGSLGYEKVKNVHMHRLGFGIPRVDGIILALFGHYYAYKLMRTQSYDLVWSIMASYGAFSAVRIKNKTGVPFLLTLQEGDSFDHIYNRVKYVRPAFNRIFTTADGIQAISQYLLTWGRTMGFKGTHEAVIPNGVDINAFTQTFSRDAVEEKRMSFGFGHDAVVLVTSSRLEPKNGISDVIDALVLLPPQVCFVICGGGSLEADIDTKIQKNGLTARVKRLGFVHPKELPLIMQSSDIFIRPSLSEGLGTAFLEAMAARKIVVGTPVGGIPDFLHDGKTGFMVGIKDPQSIQVCIERILSMPKSEKEWIKDSAERMVRETYNWEKISADMERMFTSLAT